MGGFYSKNIRNHALYLFCASKIILLIYHYNFLFTDLQILFFFCFFFIWSVSLYPLCPASAGQTPRNFYPSPNRKRHGRALLVGVVAGDFFAGKLAVKIAWRQVLPAFQGSASRLHCLKATASPPFQSGLGFNRFTCLF